jgi:hypothetical protein
LLVRARRALSRALLSSVERQPNSQHELPFPISASHGSHQITPARKSSRVLGPPSHGPRCIDCSWS